MSCAVSISSTSAPPSTSARPCSSKMIDQLLEGDVRERRDRWWTGRKPVGPIEPATKQSRAALRRFGVGGLPAKLGGAPVDLVGLLAQAVLFELRPAAAERVCLDHVGAGLEERPVDVEHDVRARQDERLVAALECATTEVVGGQVASLDARPGRTVVDQDTLAKGCQVVSGHTLDPSRECRYCRLCPRSARQRWTQSGSIHDAVTAATIRRAPGTQQRGIERWRYAR